MKTIVLSDNEVNELILTLTMELKNPETPIHRRLIIIYILERLES